MKYSAEVIAELARRHGIDGTPEPMAATGMVNDAWRIGEHVLRICVKEGCEGEAANEARVVPLAIAHGVKTPALVAIGDAPRPYTIYRCVPGIPLGDLAPDPVRQAPLFREVGRELAKLASIPVGDDWHREDTPDPRTQLAKSREAGVIDELTGAAAARYLDELEPRLVAPSRLTLIHRDIHPWNLLIDPDTLSLNAIIDWGDAHQSDPALDLSSMPALAHPAMLAGYREAGGVIDDGFEARVEWAGVALALWELRGLDPARFDRRWWRMPVDGDVSGRSRSARHAGC